MRVARLALALTLAAGLAGCGGGSGGRAGTTAVPDGGARVPGPPPPRAPDPIPRHAANAQRPRLVVGALNFPEQALLGDLYALALRKAGYRVRPDVSFGSDEAALTALRAGRIDAFPEYLGSALAVLGERVPRTRSAAYARLRRALRPRGIAALSPTPFEDATGFAASRRLVRRSRTLSGLRARAHRLVLAGPPGCRRSQECARGLRRVYGLHFRRVIEVPAPRRYAVLRSGRADVSAVSTTDATLADGSIAPLRDDRHLLAPYHVTLLVREAALRSAGSDLRHVVDVLQRTLTTRAVQRLNARIARGARPSEAARRHLAETGLAP